MSDKDQEVPERRIDPALLRGMTQRRLSRRDLMKAAGVGAAGVSLASFLAACGVSGTPASGGGSGRTTPSNGVGSALASARIRKARELGFSEGWRMISPSNGASLRTLARTGSGTRVIGELRYVKVLSHVQVWFTPQTN